MVENLMGAWCKNGIEMNKKVPQVQDTGVENAPDLIQYDCCNESEM